MMSTTTVALLRLFHIVGGAFWVGSVLFMALFLFPSFRAAGPAAGAVMSQLMQVRKFPAYMMTAAMLTVFSGVGLLYTASVGFNPQWMGSGPGRMFSLGAAFAIAAVILGTVVNSPAARKMGIISTAVRNSGGSPTPEQGAELARLSARLGWALNTAGVLVVLATAAMAVARYMPS